MDLPTQLLPPKPWQTLDLHDMTILRSAGKAKRYRQADSAQNHEEMRLLLEEARAIDNARPAEGESRREKTARKRVMRKTQRAQRVRAEPGTGAAFRKVMGMAHVKAILGTGSRGGSPAGGRETAEFAYKGKHGNVVRVAPGESSGARRAKRNMKKREKRRRMRALRDADAMRKLETVVEGLEKMEIDGKKGLLAAEEQRKLDTVVEGLVRMKIDEIKAVERDIKTMGIAG